MSIVRAPRPKGNFYILDKRISEDSKLSWSARGLLIFLLGKPDNWRVSIQNLVNETSGSSRKSGRDAVYAFLAELKEAGYITVYQNRSESGVFGETDYLVHEHSEPLPANPEAVDAPYPALPDTVQPDAIKPDTDTPNTANPTLISTKNQKRSTTTTKRGENPNERSSRDFLETLELEFEQADHLDISVLELAGIKQVVCEWVFAHPKNSVQDWIYYYATSAKFEANRGRPIQRPSAFMQAILGNPVQDWTQVEFIKTAKAQERARKMEKDRVDAVSRLEAAQEANLVKESLALFFESNTDYQQELMASFRKSTPHLSKLDNKSKIFQHAFAEWLRENHLDIFTDNLHTKKSASPGEFQIKQ